MNCIRCHSDISRDFRACPHCGEPVTEFLRRYADEPVDGKYRLLERLGAGGMGDVYKVEHTFLGSLRVIKVIRPQISESLDAHERFLREARLATRVQHPNVATLHDFSALPDGSHYMVWEYIDGENVAQLLRRRGALPPRMAVQLAIDALHGLEAIHRAGIVHRDISPENIMVTRESDGHERVRIIDLGVAKVDGGDTNDANTKTGIFVGKLRYASPEHLGFLEGDQRIDGRADTYSLAIVLYEMLTGRPPFEATSPHQYILHHSAESAFKPLPLPEAMPAREALQAILGRALAHDRNARFASAREFAGALEELARTLPVANDLSTVEEPFDPNATMRVTPASGFRDTLRRTTEVSAAAPLRSSLAEPTVRTPLPVSLATVAGNTPLPAPPPPPAAPQHLAEGMQPPAPVAPAHAAPAVAPATIAHQPRPASTGGRKLLAVLLVLALGFIVIAAGGAWLFLRAVRNHVTATTATTAPAAPTTAATLPSQSTLEVSSDSTESASPTTASTSTTTSSVDTIETQQTESTAPSASPTRGAVATQSSGDDEAERQQSASNDPEHPIETKRGGSDATAAYVEGGDDTTNDSARTAAQRALTGIRTVAVHASSMRFRMQLERAVRNMGLSPVDGEGDATIDFNGNIERLGRGRKARSADVRVKRNGRVVFRYDLPREEYRIGDDPAEAFARVFQGVVSP